jgi:hypothetical protein
MSVAKHEKKPVAEQVTSKAKIGKKANVEGQSRAAELPVDRRQSRDRRELERRKASVPVATDRRKLERREKVARRRQIDPTTCERDYSDAELEFMNAMELYKRSSGRMFPTCSEVLEVFRSLGYEKRPPVAAVSNEENPVAVVGAHLTAPSSVSAGSEAC